MAITTPRGTEDVLPSNVYKWHKIENTAREVCKNFGYSEIRTPVFEHTELFERGVGETTDVVQKEMYTFNDKKGRSITLKPEGTSPVVRSFVEHALYQNPQPTKLYYLYPCFRYEKPQAGRLREFHQFGVEVFGSDNAAIDAEVISLALSVFDKMGIGGIELKINSIGCPKCRKEYNERLREYFKPYLNDLCETCRQRYEKNPLRILDCKSEECKKIYNNAPVLLDNICPDCSKHFNQLKEYLDTMGIKYTIDGTIVRGLDYYTKTVFEIVSHNIGAQGTVCGGGRYNGLVSELGGPEMSGVGFAMGIERMILMLNNSDIDVENDEKIKLFIAGIGENADKYIQKLILEMRKQGISCERDYLSRSVKKQLAYAGKIGAEYTVVLGDDEIEGGTCRLKNMTDGEAEEIQINELINRLK